MLRLLADSKVSGYYNLMPPARTVGAWDAEAASRYALELLRWAATQQGPHGIDDPAQLILLGRRVEAAFYNNDGRVPIEWTRTFKLWCGAGPVRCMVIPHPSGRNRAYNDPKLVSLVQAALKQFCAEVK